MGKGKSGGTIGAADAGGALAALKKKLGDKLAGRNPAAPQIDKIDFARSPSAPPPPTIEARRAAARVQARKPKKERLKLPAADVAAVYAQHAGYYGKAGPAPGQAYVDAFKAAYDKVAQSQAEAEQGRISVSKPASVSAATADEVTSGIATGAAMAKAGLPHGDGGYVIGYDLGTSSTKVVLRQPFNPAAPAFAIPVPEEMRSTGQPHLWHTAIWVGKDGKLSPLPVAGYHMVEGFKAALLSGNALRYCKGGELTYAEATVGFLAMHIAYVLGVSRDQCAEEDFRLEALHVGMPVAGLKSGDGKLFSWLLAAAMSLLGEAGTLTIGRIRSAMAEKEPAATLPFLLFPELVGLVSGYSKSGARPGAHMIIDCGAATLDIATFTLPIDDGRPLPIHVARVDRLGADACEWAQDAGADHEDCVRACHHAERLVHSESVTRKDRTGFSKSGGGYAYPVVAVGGGFHSAVHAEFGANLIKALAEPFVAPRLDSRLIRDPAADPGRLLLADGLARDPIQIREWLLPDDQDHLSATRWDFDGRYPSKDQC